MIDVKLILFYYRYGLSLAAAAAAGPTFCDLALSPGLGLEALKAWVRWVAGLGHYVVV